MWAGCCCAHKQLFIVRLTQFWGAALPEIMRERGTLCIVLLFFFHLILQSILFCIIST